MLYDANGRAVRQTAGFLRQWVPVIPGESCYAVGSQRVEDEDEAIEICVLPNECPR